jgi:hypothetical protein
VNPKQRKFRSDSHDRLLPEVHCPECGIKLDAAGDTEGDDNVRPSPDDMCVCLNCGEFLAYTETMTLRKVEKTEVLGLGPEYEMQKMQLITAQMFIRQRGRFR